MQSTFQNNPVSIIVSNQVAAPLVVTVDAVALDTMTLLAPDNWPASAGMYDLWPALASPYVCNDTFICVTLHSVTLPAPPPGAWVVGFSIEGSVDGVNWAPMATETFLDTEPLGTKIVHVSRARQYRVLCSSGATDSATVTVVLSSVRN